MFLGWGYGFGWGAPAFGYYGYGGGWGGHGGIHTTNITNEYNNTNVTTNNDNDVTNNTTNNEVTDGGEVPGAITDGAGDNVGAGPDTQGLNPEYPPEQQFSGTDGGYQNAYLNQEYNNQQVLLKYRCLQ